jgi:hypothetical protein
MCKRLFDLCQILSIETLQVMEPIPKKLLTIQIIVLPYDFSKIQI